LGENDNYAGDIYNYGQLVMAPAQDQILSGAIFGEGSLLKDGDKTLTLSGDNTYGGDTTIEDGILKVAGTLGENDNYAGDIYNHGQLVMAPAQDQILSGAISGEGSLLKDGDKILTLSGDNTYGGDTTISDGILKVIGTLGENDNYAGDIYNHGQLVMVQDKDQTLSGDITGTGSLHKDGTGVLTLEGNNSYSGDTTVNNGVLSIAHDSNIGTGENTIGDGAVLRLIGSAYSTHWALDSGIGSIHAQSGDVAFSGNLTGLGALNKLGEDSLILSGSHDYAGPTMVAQGILVNSGSIASNELILNADTTFQNDGSHSLDGGALTVNGLNATYDGDLSAVGAAITFNLPVTLTDNPLKVTGDADISSSILSINMPSDIVNQLPLNHEFTLISVDGTMTAENVTFGNTVLEDLTTLYSLGVKFDQSMDSLVGLYQITGTASQTKAFSEGLASSIGLIGQAGDLVSGDGMKNATASAMGGLSAGNGGLSSFGAVSVGSMRYETGSHVDVSGFSMMVGLSYAAQFDSTTLTVGAFFEYGFGSYDTYNSFPNAPNVHGSGDTRYIGGGILAGLSFDNVGPGRLYTEASLRFGTIHNEFRSSDFAMTQGAPTSFESDSNYFGFHVGLGYIWQINESTDLDFYVKYLYTRQKGDSVTLTTGEPIVFEDAISSRVRAGARLTKRINEHVAPYVGVGWEYEFNGDAKASSRGQKFATPSLRVASGFGEVGLAFKPSKDLPVTFELGAQAHFGKKKGISGSLSLKIEF
jgi:autotransporter-associated beta strand protein